MNDKTIIDIIESNMRIVGIYPVQATMMFEGEFCNFDKFHEAIEDGDLDELLGINGVDFEESDIPIWIENNTNPNTLFMQIEAPVLQDGCEAFVSNSMQGTVGVL